MNLCLFWIKICGFNGRYFIGKIIPKGKSEGLARWPSLSPKVDKKQLKKNSIVAFAILLLINDF